MAWDVRRGAGSAGDVGVARLLNKEPMAARALAAGGEEPGCRDHGRRQIESSHTVWSSPPLTTQLLLLF
jgi:hypothetical protein